MANEEGISETRKPASNSWFTAYLLCPLYFKAKHPECNSEVINFIGENLPVLKNEFQEYTDKKGKFFELSNSNGKDLEGNWRNRFEDGKTVPQFSWSRNNVFDKGLYPRLPLKPSWHGNT